MEQSSRTVEERFNWEEGDATLPIGWKMRCSIVNSVRSSIIDNSQNWHQTNRQTQQLSCDGVVPGNILLLL